MKNTEQKKHITGVLSKHRKGFGFVAWGEDRKDIYIASRYIGSAMDGDTVVVELLPVSSWKGTSGIRIDENYRPARLEGRIIAVKKRKVREVAGTFHAVDKGRGKPGCVIPAGRDIKDEIFVSGGTGGAQDGDKVVVKITQYPDRYRRAEGKITEIISSADKPGGDIRLIARSFGMRERFPVKAAEEARALRTAYRHRSGRISDEELKGRRDLRSETIFTIDGEDSKDFDDAVSIGILDNGNYLLGIHIADVSHYVTEGSAMDAEALKRGTSVYLLDQVIPMLPKDLSNDLCSLKPGEDRLTLSLDIELDSEGEVVGHEIYESVICSKARLVYDDVSDLLEGVEKQDPFGISKGRIVGNYGEIENALFTMGELAAILRSRKEERGSVDFDIEETSIVLDETGAPVSVGVTDRRTANRLIEEFMLTANEVIAEHFRWMEAPFIYRVHERPESDKIDRLKVFLQSFGITLRSSSDKVHPKTLSRMLAEVQGSPYENVINTVTLRSMQKAYYSTSCDGHFGLALDNYCHFTSPIRRYPDLMIHRIIKSVINDGPTDSNFRHFAAIVQEAADMSSVAERKAVEAEREVVKLKKAEYMSGQIGKVYDGIISGVTGFGFFVELDNTIEGLVRIEELFDDYYEFIPDMYMLQGTVSDRKYRLGDRVVIIVESVDMDRREINFCLA